jgi:serine/threonine protein kinase/formylglycine-generating enzyme required for sulfatase activity
MEPDQDDLPSFTTPPLASVGNGGAPADDGVAEELLGEYRLLEKLGEGGMGVVYKARHLRLDRIVAVKLLHRRSQSDEWLLSRFDREMKAVGRLNHPNVIHAYDARDVGGVRMLVTEFVDGVELRELLSRCQPLAIADACEMARQAAAGLQAAHEIGLVHRDVKPSNLMLSRHGQVKLLDLGLARLHSAGPDGGDLTTFGQLMGTADFIAPEQVGDCHNVDIRADVYSLGCTLYNLLTGEPPFCGPRFQTAMQKMSAHVLLPAPDIRQRRGDVPESLAAILERMLAKAPADRFGTPEEVVQALTPLSQGADLVACWKQCQERRPPSKTPEACRRTEYGTVEARPASGERSGEPRSQSPVGPASQPGPALRDLAARRASRWLTAPAVLLLTGAAIWVAVTGGNAPPTRSAAPPQTPASQAAFRSPETTNPRSDGANAASQDKPANRPASSAAEKSEETPREIENESSDRAKIAPVRRPAELPKPAVAPFDADVARAFQRAWSGHLGIPVEQVNSIGMKLVLVPPGEFVMGTAPPEANAAAQPFGNESPPHPVRITRPFLLGACEVTQEQFRRVMGRNPSRFSAENEGQAGPPGQATAALPVESVPWREALEFCHKLSGEQAEFSARRNYRLPTEAEWEYAGRAGTVTPWHCGDRQDSLEEHAWFLPAAGESPHAVGGKRPNAWGLYDTSGNVYEWCSDWYGHDYYAQSPVEDPVGPARGLEQRVIRGGYWGSDAAFCRSAARAGAPVQGMEQIGFRVLCELEGKSPPSP